MTKEQLAYKRGFRITESGDVIGPRGSVLKKRVNPNRYYTFAVRKPKQQKNYRIGYHRYQAFQKFGTEMYKDGIVVRHLNGDCLDNSADNIAIGTRSDNSMDIPEQIRYAASLHATSFCRKHDKNKIREFHKTSGRSYKKTMQEFNISSKGTLHFILNSK